MRVGVTGPRGFTAGHLMRRLVAAGHEVIGISRPPNSGALHDPAWRTADFSRPDTIADAFDGLDVLVHLAGIAHAPTLLPALIASGTRRSIFVGSTGIYTTLHSPDADVKRAAETSIQESGLEWTILRATMIYGTQRDRNMIRLLRSLDRFPVFPAPGGRSTLHQPVHVDDVCSALVACIDRPDTAQKVYDIGGPSPLRFSEIVKTAGDALGKRGYVLPIPSMPAYHALRAVRAIGLRTPIWPEQILRLREHKSVSIAAAVQDLGFSPRTFAEGIRSEAELLRVDGKH